MLGRYMRENCPTAKRQGPVSVNCWNKALTYRNLYDRMQKVGGRAGVKELKPHRIRHSYSTNFLNSGGGIEHLQSQLAHAHVRVKYRLCQKPTWAESAPSAAGFNERVEKRRGRATLSV